MRYQTGYIFRKGWAWYLRYYAPDGHQACHKLADFSDRYRTKRDLKPLAEDFLRPLNEGRLGPQSTLAVADFVDQHYLPAIRERLRPSTTRGYEDLWKKFIRKGLTKIQLCDFRCADGDRLLAGIAREHQLSRCSFYNIKSLLSGVFKFAKRQGIMDCANPMQDVSIPARAKPGAETYAYSLEEIQRMIAELPDTARHVVATAAFTGLRKSELRGLRWEDYIGNELRVSRAVWRRHTSEPKTERSKAPVPVISLLKGMLDSQRQQRGPIFSGRNGRPLNLDNLARRVIVPVLRLSNIKWHGWHAFRRGLATNLHRLGVDDKTVQAILRHSSLGTTQDIYIKTVSGATEAAMERLQAALESKPARPN